MKYSEAKVRDAIKFIRKTEKLSIVEMVALLDVSRPSFSKMLEDKSNPSLPLLVKFLNAYPNLNLEWVFTGEGEYNKSNNDHLLELEDRITFLENKQMHQSELIMLLQDSITAYKDTIVQLKTANAK